MKLPILTGGVTRKLTPMQATFILACLTLSYEQRRAAGHRRRRKGIYLELADRFGVHPSCIKKIATRQNWKTLRLPQLYDITERSR